MKARAMLCLILVIPLASWPPSAEAQAAPRWWDTPEVQGSDDYEKGWNLRVPVLVQNHHPFTLARDHPVLVHLHPNQLAAEAGWIAAQTDGPPAAKTFTFDPDSVRIVRYGANWAGVGITEVASRTHQTWYEPDQTDRYDRIQTRPFDKTTNTVATVLWLLDEPLPPGGRLHYYAYFDAQENSVKPAPSYPDQDEERLDGAFWVGRGTELWGHVAGSNQKNLEVTATEPMTTVTLLEYRPGFPHPTIKDLGTLPNPFVLQDAGDRKEFTMVAPDRFVKIHADKPVLAAERPGNTALGFVPSLDRNLLGTDFAFTPRQATAFFLMAGDPQEGATVSVTPPCGQVQQIVILGNEGFRRCPASAGVSYRIQSDNPILVQEQPRKSGPQVQVPSVETGSPLGRTYYASLSAGTNARLLGVDQSSHPAVYASPSDSEPVYPEPGSDPIRMEPGWTNRVTVQSESRIPFLPPQDPTFSNPVLAWSDPNDDAVPEDARGRFAFFVGGHTTPTTPVGGKEGLDFFVDGAVAVFGHYNGTVLRIRDAADADQAVTTRRVGHDGFVRLEAADAVEVRSDKPVTVIPIPSFPSDRFLAGRLPQPTVDVLIPEFRGFQVGVESPSGSDPFFVTARPGDAVTVPVLVENRGRWSGGITLKDTVVLLAEAPASLSVAPSWIGSGGDTVQVPLDGGQSAKRELQIQVPSTESADFTAVIKVIATSTKNPNMTDTLQVLLHIEESFGVDLAWVDGNSPNDIVRDDMEPGDVITEAFIVENIGTAVDDFLFADNSGRLGLGWKARVVAHPDSEERVRRVDDMDPREQRKLYVRITAPESTDQSISTPYTLQASSVGSQSHGDAIQGTFGLAVRLDVALDVDGSVRTVQPGGTAEFPLNLTNEGEGPVTLRLSVSSQLEAGWTAEFIGVPATSEGHDVTLSPGQRLGFQVHVTAPADALMGDFLPLLVDASTFDGQAPARAAASMTAVVGRAVSFTATVPDGFQVAPGDTLQIPVAVAHSGNAPARYLATPLQVPAGWAPQQLPAADFPTPPTPDHAVDGPLLLNLTVPVTTVAGIYGIEVRVHDRDGGFLDLTTAVTVSRAIDRTVELPTDPVRIGPQDNVTVPIRLRNLGNTPLTLEPQADPPPGWNVTVSPALVALEPGRNATVFLGFEAPSGETVGSHAVAVQVTARETNTASHDTLQFDYRLPDIAVSSVQPLSAAPPRTGDVVFFAAALRNEGLVPASNVAVDLVAGGQAVDSVRLGRLAPNATALVTLQMVWSDPSLPLEVVANADGVVPEEQVDNNRAGIPMGTVPDAQGTPGPAFVVSLFAPLGVAWAVRRRRP